MVDDVTTTSYNTDRQVDVMDEPAGYALDIDYEGDDTPGVTTDNSSRVDRITAGDGVIEPSYDPTSGRVTAISRSDGVDLGFIYDGPLVQRLTWDLTGGLVGFDVSFDDQLRLGDLALDGFSTPVCFRYDLDGALRAIGSGTWDSCTTVMSFEPDILTGRLQSTTLETIETAYDYNGFGELEWMNAVNSTDSTFGLSFEYDRDALGRITHATEQRGGVTGPVTERWYTYDATDQLEGVWDSAPPADPDCSAEPPQAGLLACWEYDGNANRVFSRTCNGGASPLCVSESTGSPDAQDRVEDFGNIDVAYDDRGTATVRRDVAADREWRYTYDTVGSLRKVEIGAIGFVDPTTTIVYDVDAMNRRVGRREYDGVEDPLNLVGHRQWIYQGALRPVAELDGDGNVVSRFVYGTRVNVPEYMVRGGVTYRIVTDHLGSVRMVVNVDDGTIVQEMEYDAWGNATYEDHAAGFDLIPFGYAGGLYDQKTGLVRFGARDYDPEVGRWTAKDPILFGGGDTNLYVYVGNDPVNRIDPTGLEIYVCAVGWHTWIVTDTYASGLAGWFNLDFSAVMREHSSDISYPAFDCTPIPSEDVDEECVDSLIAPGTSRGWLYFPLFNDCQSVISRTFSTCSISDRIWSVAPISGRVVSFAAYSPPPVIRREDYIGVRNYSFDFSGQNVVYR